MTYEEAKKQYLDRREKTNAIGLGFYLNSLDVETGVAPSQSFAYRSKQLEVLSGMIYDMTTSPEAMESIRVLSENETEDQALLHEVRLAAEQAEKLAKIPKEEYLAFNALLNEVYPVYVTAKQTSDFSLFEPYLQKIFDYNRKYVNWVGGEKQGYDVLLDEFERDYGQKEYDEFFALLKEAIVPLVKEISGRSGTSRTPHSSSKYRPRSSSSSMSVIRSKSSSLSTISLMSVAFLKLSVSRIAPNLSSSSLDKASSISASSFSISMLSYSPSTSRRPQNEVS